MDYGLNNRIISEIRSVFALFNPIEKVILYGSRAKNTYKQSSDIDFTVVGKELTPQELVEIEWKLDELYLPYKIDLSIYHLITNKALLEHIDRVGIIFYERNN